MVRYDTKLDRTLWWPCEQSTNSPLRDSAGFSPDFVSVSKAQAYSPDPDLKLASAI